MRSLRRRLLAWLLPPLVVVGVVAGAGAYVFMERRLTAAYDQNLGDIARALVPYIRVEDARVSLDFSKQADAILRADSQDKIYYAVIDPAGHVVAGDRALPAAPAMSGEGPWFWDDERNRVPIRAVALHTEVAGAPIRIIAAETTNKRERASRDALVSAIAPVALLSGAAILAVLFGVGRGLGPLEKLREELQARSHVDLSPVDESRVVQELRPVVRELNGMLARLEAAQHSQARFIANAAQDVVRDQADTWLRSTTGRGVELEFDLTPAPIVGNGLLVGELASNLVDNAARYGAKTVRIATHRDAKRSLLEVSDDGPGIPAEERTRIFERFHRLQNNASTEGSGLGLAIVHEIAQRHRAEIEVGEPAQGLGTRVSVAFPSAAPD